jgi:hypothetical protein
MSVSEAPDLARATAPAAGGPRSASEAAVLTSPSCMAATIARRVTSERLLSKLAVPMARKTKIVCAIGPACSSKAGMLALLDAGMNVARLNFSHGTHELHAASVANLRAALAERPHVHCAVLMDTKGPEARALARSCVRACVRGDGGVLMLLLRAGPFWAPTSPHLSERHHASLPL